MLSVLVPAVFLTGPTLLLAPPATGFLAKLDDAGRLEAKGFLVAAGEARDVALVGGLAAVLAAEDAVGLLLKGARLVVVVGLLTVDERAVERDVVLGAGLPAAAAAVEVGPFL